MTYDDFAAFVRAEVLPLQAAHPDWVRVDGRTEKSNPAPFGRFAHNGTTWRVHADTHFHPLLAAFAAAELGAEPFVERPTKDGRCLELAAALRPDPTAPKHLYIYAEQ